MSDTIKAYTPLKEGWSPDTLKKACKEYIELQVLDKFGYMPDKINITYAVKGSVMEAVLNSFEDADIDCLDIPELDKEFWSNAKVVYPKTDTEA